MPGWNEPVTWGVFFYLPVLIGLGIAGIILVAMLVRAIVHGLAGWRWNWSHCRRRPHCETGSEGLLCGCFCVGCSAAKSRGDSGR